MQSRLWFFPALLPFASLLPGLLAVVGAVAAGVQAVRRRWRSALVFAALMTLILGASVWRFVRNEQKAKLLPTQLVVETLPVQNTSGAWSQLLPRAPLSSGTLSSVHQLLIYGTRDKTLDAISLRDGSLAFSLQMAEPVLSQPLIIDDLLLVGEGLHDARKARLIAVHLPDGKPVWQHTFLSHVESSPRYSKALQLLFTCAGDDRLSAVELKSGNVRWHQDVGHCDTTPWLNGEELIVVGQKQGRSSELMMLKANDGTPIGSMPLPGQPWGTPFLDETSRLILLTTGIGQLGPSIEKEENGWLHAIEADGKKVRWTQPLHAMPLFSNILKQVASRRLIIQATKPGEVFAFDVKTGSRIWRTKLSSPILATPTLLSNTNQILVAAFDGTLLSLDAATGRILKERRLSPQVTAAPIVDGNRIYVLTRPGLFVLPLENGTFE